MPRVSADHLTARREQILTGARSCFSRYGYEGATVRRLEEATGLSRGAIFHHFRDKDSLFLELARTDNERMAEVVAAHGLVQVMRDVLADSPDPAGGDPIGAGGNGEGRSSWLGTRLEIARRLRTDPAFREDWSGPAAQLHRAVRERLIRQREAGVVRADLPVEALAAYLEMSFEGLISQLAMGTPATELSGVLDVVESGVRA